MKALCKCDKKYGAKLIDTDIPKIKPDELLIKVTRTSICGSDLPIYEWKGWAKKRIKPPFTFGHELCGEVIEMGEKARGFTKGDFVSVESHIFCGLCYQCRNDQRHVCANMKILGIDTVGGFSEYAAIPARCAWKHPDKKFKDIGSIMEPLGNAVHAVLVEDVVSKTVLVTGCGSQGLFAIDVARAGGASKIIAVEGAAFRKKLAKKMGADVVFDPKEVNLLSKIKKYAGDGGVDVVCEMSGNPNAINLGLKAVKNAGRFTAFGLTKDKIKIDYSNDIVFKGIKIYAIAGREIFKSWYKMENLLRSKAINPRPVITHVYPMKDYKKAFETMLDPQRRCGKVVMIP
ncbi:MAG TPA: L-threonine 3-dehydrogenase [Elusimicrobiales bacterium]|nr:L-threonine 3-dehydrogenase [Elusimicrobiales bacterium]